MCVCKSTHADRAGIQVGDVIKTINGHDQYSTTINDLINLIKTYNEPYTIAFYRQQPQIEKNPKYCCLLQ